MRALLLMGIGADAAVAHSYPFQGWQEVELFLRSRWFWATMAIRAEGE
jgi:hypothetical protein